MPRIDGVSFGGGTVLVSVSGRNYDARAHAVRLQHLRGAEVVSTEIVPVLSSDETDVERQAACAVQAKAGDTLVAELFEQEPDGSLAGLVHNYPPLTVKE